MSEEALQIYEKRREVKGNGERERYTQGGIPGGSVGKETSCNAGVPGLIPGSGNIPWRKKWQPIPLFLLRKSHGQRSLAGCSLWGCKRQA